VGNTRIYVERRAHHPARKVFFIKTIYWQKSPIMNTKMRNSSILIASQLLQVPVYGFSNQRRVVGEEGKDIIINI